MDAKVYSLQIEALLRKFNGLLYRKSDEIALSPYEEIVLALIGRVSQGELDKFKLLYQATEGRTLQELLDENYDVEQLLEDLKKTVENGLCIEN